MHVHNVQRREEERTLARWIKYINGKFKKAGTTLVTEQQNYSNTLEITEKKHYRRLKLKKTCKITTRLKELVHYLMIFYFKEIS